MVSEKLEYDRLVRSIAKGAGILLIGTFLGRLFGYLIRVFIARVYDQEVYGYLSTSYAVFIILTTIGLLGLSNSLPRQISYYFAKNKIDAIRSNIGIAFLFVGAIGILLCVGLSLSANYISVNFFNNSNLTPFFIYFGLAIPFYLISRIEFNIFQGFKKMIAFTIFRHISQRSLILILLLCFFVFQVPSKHIGLTYLFAYIFSMIAALFALFKISPIRFGAQIDFKTGKTLFQFSWPLMFSSIIMLLMHQTDTIMLGYFLTQSKVGIYNAAVPIGEFLSVIYVSFTPLLIPVMTEYFAKKSIKELKHTFELSTKWIFLFTFPVYLLIMIFPHFFLKIMFGAEYLAATNVLRLIATGIFFSAMVGPTGGLLIVIGKPNLVLLDSSIGYVVNVLLNILLIPKYGILGAASATAISLIIHNSITVVQVYYYLHLISFRNIYVRITAAGIIPGLLIWILFKYMNDLLVFISCLFFLVIYALFCYLFKIIKEEDKMILREVKKRVHR